MLAVGLGVFVRANSLVGHLQAKKVWMVSGHCVLHKSGAAVAHGIESVSVETTSEQLGGMGAITESTLEVTKSLIDFAAESIMVNVANGYDNHAVSEESAGLRGHLISSGVGDGVAGSSDWLSEGLTLKGGLVGVLFRQSPVVVVESDSLGVGSSLGGSEVGADVGLESSADFAWKQVFIC